jgi:hypothetical protein
MPAGTASGIGLWERAQEFRRLRAAAQLDQKLLRNFTGLKQCSQKPPVTDGNLKLRPDCSHRPIPDTVPLIGLYSR